MSSQLKLKKNVENIKSNYSKSHYLQIKTPQIFIYHLKKIRDQNKLEQILKLLKKKKKNPEKKNLKKKKIKILFYKKKKIRKKKKRKKKLKVKKKKKKKKTRKIQIYKSS